MGPHSHHTAQEGDAFCLLEMSVLCCEKWKSIPEQQQRTMWNCWRKHVQSIYIHIKTSPISTYPERPLNKEPLLQNRHKKARLFATAHGDKDCTLKKYLLLWWNKISNCLAIMTIMLGGERGRFHAKEHHPNREARGLQYHVGVLCCRRDWWTSQTRLNHV